MRVYISAPLFNQMEKEFNLRVDSELRAVGFETYLPQRDGYEGSELIKSGYEWNLVKNKIFEKDVSEIKKCDILFMVLDGRVPDEGACVETGIAYAIGKKCIGLQTDTRKFSENYNNPMIDGTLNLGLYTSLNEALKKLQEIKK